MANVGAQRCAREQLLRINAEARAEILSDEGGGAIEEHEKGVTLMGNALADDAEANACNVEHTEAATDERVTGATCAAARPAAAQQRGRRGRGRGKGRSEQHRAGRPDACSVRGEVARREAISSERELSSLEVEARVAARQPASHQEEQPEEPAIIEPIRGEPRT